MTLRTKIFLLLSAVLFFSIMVYVWVYAGMDHRRVIKGLEQRAKQAEYSFKAELTSTEMRMLQIATFVAHDKEVQQLFLLGKKAVELEGGGGGGELAAQVRTSLYEHVQESQKALAGRFGFRQLQFHFGPGSLSFLRVHRPEKFGDRMDKVRYTIVTANAQQKNTMGFETGRVVSGIRGVTPVYAFDGSTKKKVHVGALEAGTSFANMLTLFSTNRPWLNGAVLLSREHLQANIWPDFLDKLAAENQFIKDFRIEGTTSSKIKEFLVRNDISKLLTTPGHLLLRDGDISYSFISFPLRDFRGETDPDQPDAGLVIIWQDISTTITAYYKNVRNLILYGILLFILIELLMFYGLKLMTSGLQRELEETQKHEVESEHARLVAEDTSRLKTEFLSNMSHELRTPLNVIVGMGDILSQSSLDHRQQNIIEKIKQSSNKLLNMINEILFIAEIDTQAAVDMSNEYYHLAPLVRGLKEKFTIKAKEQRVNFKIDLSADLPDQISGYPDQLEQILSQLVGNAIKFGHDGDVTLAVKLLEQEDEIATLEFAVTDQGIGISAEQQEQIFQSFYQGDGTKTRKYEGAGLGLTIAQKICRQLGGEIRVESSLGQGSCFRFQLEYKVLAGESGFVSMAEAETITAAVEVENISPQEIGTISELAKLLQQLEDHLVKMQPCQEIASQLKKKQWPEKLTADIEDLTHLIDQYRFVEAQDVVERLKELVS